MLRKLLCRLFGHPPAWRYRVTYGDGKHDTWTCGRCGETWECCYVGTVSGVIRLEDCPGCER